MEMGLQPQCFVNCIGKIRMAGYISKPEDARPDNPIDYLVHIRKVALPLYPQFGLEPNVYYIPPVHVPPPFLRQMFGPGVDEAIRTYRNAANDTDLAGLMGLFGSTESVMTRWRREGEQIVGMDDAGTPLVRVPLREPVHIRSAFDKLYQITRVKCP
jgi:nitrate reductase beta subunit